MDGQQITCATPQSDLDLLEGLAKRTAWDVYMHRVTVVIDQQYQAWRVGRPAPRVAFEAPTQKEIDAIHSALHGAARSAVAEVLHHALAPIVQALDAIDNSGAKGQTTKAARAGIQTAYDELHKLKAACESATKADAVARSGGGDHEPSTRA